MGIARMSSVDYLCRHIAAGDGRGGAPTPLTRYYTADGYPPGRWHGAGLTDLSGGGPAPGSEVTEPQLRALFENAADPVSGDRLGRQAPAKYRTRAERIAYRVAKLPEQMPAADRDRTTARITEEEQSRPVKQPVTGFDLTFSPPKSVSVL
jgi:TrwC relaxase